jgi:hypothetical protein
LWGGAMLHPPFLYNEWWGFVKLPASRLRDFENHYKIKLKKAGFRLVYEVLDDEKSLLVAVGKRADNLVYRKAQERSNRL